MKKLLPARGRLAARMGVLEHTPSISATSHHTWWIRPGVTAIEREFQVVNLTGDGS
ncbi:MAG: hypothetical protein ACRELB_05980 [Polyangiaceae bacterium]